MLLLTITAEDCAVENPNKPAGAEKTDVLLPILMQVEHILLILQWPFRFPLLEVK